MEVGGHGVLGCQEAAVVSPPLVGPGSYSCGPTHFGFSGRVEGEAQQGARSGWAFVGSCRNLVSRTGALWRRHSLDLAPGSKAGGRDSESMEPLDAGRKGSGLGELQGAGAAEGPGRSEGSSGTEHQGDDPALRAVGWSSWLLRVL